MVKLVNWLTGSGFSIAEMRVSLFWKTKLEASNWGFHFVASVLLYSFQATVMDNNEDLLFLSQRWQ